MDAGFGLALAFDSDDEQFARGFEAGRVWALLHQHERPLMVTVHKSNAEMLLRMAEATNRKVATTEFAEPDDAEYEHLVVEFSASPVSA